MAPSLEESEAVDVSAPPKAAPQLVAPEPGKYPQALGDDEKRALTTDFKNTALARNLNLRDNLMLALVALTSRYVLLRPKVLILIYQSSLRVCLESSTKSWSYPEKVELVNPHSAPF